MHLRPEFLRPCASDLLCARGTPPDRSSRVAASLIHADLRGNGGHGISILPLYAEMVTAEAIDPLAEPAIEGSAGCIINVNGNSAFGQLTGEVATTTGIETASQHGVAVVGIRNGAHLGRLGEWAEQATSQGMVFIAFANAGGGARNVAPFGGHERKLSTNPVAFGVPTFGALPFNVIVDFATSQVSGAVIREHYRAGLPLDDEWTTTATGEAVATALEAAERPAPPHGQWWWGTGRRKSAVARVRIRPGEGTLIINKRSYEEYFTEERDRNDLVNVLNKTKTEGQLEIHVNVHGGGYTGQAGAIVLGLGRALRGYDQTLEPILRENAFLTRDPRKVERKKYGQPGARKRFQFSKR